MKKYIALLSIVFCLSIGGFAQNGDVKIITDSDSGKKIELKKGQMLDIVLDENATTGYSWMVTWRGTPYIKEIAKSENKQDKSFFGASSKRTFHFKAVSKGNTFLSMIYQRPFEKKPPIKQFRVTIKIR